MAEGLLALLIVLGVQYSAPEWVRLRDYGWLRAWIGRWRAWRGGKSAGIGVPGLLGVGLIPVLLLALLDWTLSRVLFGLPGFLLSVLVLYYALGPRDLDADLRQWLAAPDTAARRAFAAHAFGRATAGAPELVESVFAAALRRWFAPIFWFLLFGPAGALGYRLVQLGADQSELAEDLGSVANDWARRVHAALAYLPAQLMTLALALTSDFDAVAQAWREHHQRHGQGYLYPDLALVTSTARACIDFDDGDDELDVDASPAPSDAPVRRAHGLLRRMLIAWLAAIALAVLIGWTG